MTKIVSRVKPDEADTRLVRIDESAITVDEGIQSYCILAVSTSIDDEKNAVYGVNLISSEQEGKEVNDAEVFVRRALQLIIDDLDKDKPDPVKLSGASDEKEEEKE